MPIGTVKLLGHTNIKITKIYARITNEKMREYIEVGASKLTSIEDVALKNRLSFLFQTFLIDGKNKRYAMIRFGSFEIEYDKNAPDAVTVKI